MLRKYFMLITQLRLHLLKMRIKSSLPYLGVKYRQGKKEQDLFEVQKMKSHLQQQLMADLFGKHAKGILFDTSNGMLVSNVSDVTINNALGFRGEYDKAKLEFIVSFLQEDHCVYIIGAHIGTLIRPIRNKVEKVYAFEANPDTYKYLLNNIHINDFDNVEAFNRAVYDSETNIAFYQSKVNTGGSKIKPVKDHFMYRYDDPQVIQVNTAILDNFIVQNGLIPPNVIIMDIEGAEFRALKGAAQSLAQAAYLYIEFVPHHLSNVAGVSLEEFLNAISPYYQTMSVVEEIIQQQNVRYKGDGILVKLRQLQSAGQSADLLFTKAL